MQLVSPFYFVPKIDYSEKLKGVFPKGTSLFVDSTPDQILDVLSLYSFLKECYSKQMEGGLSVREHAHQVLSLAQKYRGQLQLEVSKTALWEDFLLFLALHNIGKGVAKENEPFAFSTPRSLKQAELAATREILTATMKGFGLTDDRICLFCEMLKYDTQNLYLKEEISLEEAFDNILEMAACAHADPIAFHRIFRAYHMLDAASYPDSEKFIEIGAQSLHYCTAYRELDNELFQALEDVKKGKEFFEAAIQRVRENQDPAQLHHDFLLHLPQLLRFLDQAHKEMLAYPEHPPHVYLTIKRGFRDILLYFAQSALAFGNLKISYSAFLQDPSQFYSLAYFFDDPAPTQLLSELTDKLLHFRRDYLCRYSLKKVESFIREKMPQGTPINDDLLSLLSITYQHPTHSAILPFLLETGMQVVPLDSSQKSARKRPPNQRIEETALAPSISKEEKMIISFLESAKIGTVPEVTEEISKAILKFRAIDAQAYHDRYKDLLAQAFKTIEAGEKTRSGCMSMATGYLGLAIEEDLVVPKGTQGVFSAPYPMILASKTLHTPPSNPSQKTPLLGKDIQILFAAEADQDRLQIFLEEKGLDKKIAIIDIDDLPKATLLSQLAAPYFANIASIKKLTSLTSGAPRQPLPSMTSTPISFDIPTYQYALAGLVVVGLAAAVFKRVYS